MSIPGFKHDDKKPNKEYWRKVLEYFEKKLSKAPTEELKKYYQEQVERVKKNIKEAEE